MQIIGSDESVGSEENEEQKDETEEIQHAMDILMNKESLENLPIEDLQMIYQQLKESDKSSMGKTE